MPIVERGKRTVIESGRARLGVRGKAVQIL